MKNYSLVLFKIFILFILLFSCSKADEQQCDYSNPTYVTSVSAATNIGKVNETINIKVNFQVSSGCGGFGRFIETENGNSKTIQVEAKYVGCVCTQNAPIIAVNYKFIAQTKGNYTLNFKSSETEFITVNFTIN